MEHVSLHSSEFNVNVLIMGIKGLSLCLIVFDLHTHICYLVRFKTLWNIIARIEHGLEFIT